MKKFIAAVAAAVMFASMSAMSAWAAGPQMSAKAGAATVDGVISEGEYGDPFVINKDNGITWIDNKPDAEVKYYFAWSEEALYIAVSVPADKVATELTAQLNFNPGKLIPDDKLGLFLGMKWEKGKDTVKVTQHNHSTALQKGSDVSAIDITKKVEVAVKADENVVIELRLPEKFFTIQGIKGEFKLEAGAVLDASPFVIFVDGEVQSAFAVIDGEKITKWEMGKMKLGQISLEKGNATEPSKQPSASATSTSGSNATAAPTKKPDQPNASTFDMGIVSLAAVALSSVVAIKKRK